MAKSKIIFRNFLMTENGAVPFEELTPEQHEDVIKKMSEKLSRSMSDYYTQHPDEFEKI